MTEDKSGLEKYTFAFARRLGKKIEGGGGKRKEQGFTAEQAIEKFKLLSAAGPEGQEPIISYESRSTIILSDQERFPPGTIIREEFFRQDKPFEYSDNERQLIADARKIGIEHIEKSSQPEPKGPYYLWHCIGDFDKERKILAIFTSSTLLNGQNMAPVYVLFEKPSPGNGSTFAEHEIRSNAGNKVEFCVGEDSTIHRQTEAMKRMLKNSFSKDRTIKVDVIAFGKKVKKEVREKRKVGLKQLVPQRVPSAF